MMTEQERVKHLIYTADISEWDWFDTVLTHIEDKYAKGYLVAMSEKVAYSIDTCDEEFREELLKVSSYNIWGK